MSAPTPIERDNVLLEKNEPLTSEDKKRFAYFGEKAKILPPFRILNSPEHSDRRLHSHPRKMPHQRILRSLVSARLCRRAIQRRCAS